MNQYNYDRPSQIQKYSGFPHKHSEQELTKWQEFLTKVLPWLKRKWELADKAAEARLFNEIASAELKQAEAEHARAQAQKALAEARKITEEAAKIEQQRLDITPIQEITDEATLTEEVELLAEKIELLRLKYGMEVQLSIQSPNAVQTITSSTSKVTGESITPSDKPSPEE